MEKHAKKFGAKVVFAEVTRIRKEGEGRFVLETTEGEFRAKAVIWATGAEPRKLGVPGEKEFTGKGVSYCAVCDGGDSAFTEGLYLSGIVKKVYLIHRRDQFRAQKIYVEQMKKKPNVEFLLNKVVVEFVGDKMLKGLRLRDTKTGEESFLEVSAAFVYIGLRPMNDLVKDFVDLPGLFVAGDGRVKPLRQVVTAVADGAVAAMIADEYIR